MNQLPASLFILNLLFLKIFEEAMSLDEYKAYWCLF